jgi:hypothetical protein
MSVVANEAATANFGESRNGCSCRNQRCKARACLDQCVYLLASGVIVPGRRHELPIFAVFRHSGDYGKAEEIFSSVCIRIDKKQLRVPSRQCYVCNAAPVTAKAEQQQSILGHYLLDTGDANCREANFTEFSARELSNWMYSDETCDHDRLASSS